MTTIAFIGLGSNLEQPLAHIEQAAAALNELTDTRLIAVSPLYLSKAIGPGEQPDYVNAAAAVETSLPPHQLLAQLQEIENQQGRTRGPIRWVARTLDLDLLLFGDRAIDTDDLIIPHPRMTKRNFVLYPLRDLALSLAGQLNEPLSLPDGRLITSLADQCDSSGIKPLH